MPRFKHQHPYNWKIDGREDRLRDMYFSQSKEVIMAAFPGPSWKAIVGKARRLGLLRRSWNIHPDALPLQRWEQHHKALHEKYELNYEDPFNFREIHELLQERQHARSH